MIRKKQPTEEQVNDFHNRVEKKVLCRALEEAFDLRMAKHVDYNVGPVMLQDYFPFGLKSYVQEINKKSLRLVSMASQARVTKNEPLRDTLLDLINYCCFAIEAIDDETIS